MILGLPAAAYDPVDQAALRDALRREDGRNQKVDADYRLDAGPRLVLLDEVTGELWRLKVAGGVISLEAFG